MSGNFFFQDRTPSDRFDSRLTQDDPFFWRRESEFRDELLKIGVKNPHNLTELIDFIVEINNKVEQLTKDKDHLIKSWDECTQELKKVKDQQNILEEKEKKAADNIIPLNREIQLLKEQMKAYGKHSRECGYIQLLSSGRMQTKGAEKKSCTCGWFKTREDLDKVVEEVKEPPKAEDVPF